MDDIYYESFEFLHFVSFREAIATRNLYDLSFFKISPFGRNDKRQRPLWKFLLNAPAVFSDLPVANQSPKKTHAAHHGQAANSASIWIATVSFL
jgi:hypothetical protein